MPGKLMEADDMHGSNGGNGHQNGNGHGHEHGEDRDVLSVVRSGLASLSQSLDRKMASLDVSIGERIDGTVETFRGLMTMAEDAAQEYAARLDAQAREIAALKQRVDALEARRSRRTKGTTR